MAAISEAEPLTGELRVGELEVRLATSEEEIKAAQALRYRVFYEEMAAHASSQMQALRRDFDKFDPMCDHLLAIDHSRKENPVVGTYRLIKRDVATRLGGFYTQDEYDIDLLLAHPGPVLELGRSCVDIDYRNRPTLQLLWRGIAAYLMQNEIELMFGCASLYGTDPSRLRLPLAYLHQNYLAPKALRARALPNRYIDMRLVEPELIDQQAAKLELPPLIKGYLRVGAFVGDGAVIDEQFNTTDVCIILKTELIADRYSQRYFGAARE